jgi:uncharacterized protein YfaQ (DUF2300 family)
MDCVYCKTNSYLVGQETMLCVRCRKIFERDELFLGSAALSEGHSFECASNYMAFCKPCICSKNSDLENTFKK